MTTTAEASAVHARPRITMWATARHQLRLRRQVDEIARHVDRLQKLHAEAIADITADNRSWRRRALEAEGFIAASGLERTYGIRDTARRPGHAASENGATT